MSAPGEHAPCRCSVLPVADPVTLDHLDEDWAVPCERVGKPNCGHQNPAEWVLTVLPCCTGRRISVVWCGPCKDRIFARNRSIICIACGHRWPSPVEAYALIEPLNRRTT